MAFQRNHRLLLFTLAISMSLSTACESDSEEKFDLIDATSQTDVVPNFDTGTDTDDGSTIEIPEGVAVPIELKDYLEGSGSAGEGSTRVYRLQPGDELASGAAAEARAGDWVLENDRVKLFVEDAKRAMSPCPYGGNIIDAQVKGEDDTLSPDNTGEICLMINVGQTFAPERFDVVLDGSASGGPSVLAVSGKFELLDFIDVKSMADDYAPGILDNVSIKPDDIVPARVTRYFILMPGESHVRVVAAVQNTDDQRRDMVTGHLMRGGGHGHFFNPISRLNGWGYTSLGVNNLNGDPLPFVAYSGPTGGYAYVPEPDPDLLEDPTDFPRGGVQAAISGVSLSLLGRDNVAETLLARADQLETLPGLLHLEPQEVGIIEHREYFGGGGLSSLTDEIYPYLVEQTGTLRGTVLAGDGSGVSEARVSAINADGNAMSQAVSDEDGNYQMVLPVGDYQIRARLGARVSLEDAEAAVAANAPAEADVELKGGATIRVAIKTPSGETTPGRVSVFCEGPCLDTPTSLEADVSYDPLPAGFSQVQWTRVDGTVDIEVAAGRYRVSVSRGMEWSVWPQSAPDDGGFLVEVADGDTVDVESEIAHVVDTSGVLNGDFHVHGITSADSVVRPASRVRGFMGDGVDVLVSTDHDYIFDYGPTVAALGAENEIVSMVGVEITTPNIGHFNSFPLIRDPDDSRGGAVDWGRGTEFSMTPAELFAWMDGQDGDPDNVQVKQINHPKGTVAPLQADVLRGISYATPESKRMEPTQPDPDNGDTGLWSDDFNAIEVMNGNNMSEFWTIMRWWLTMISRGFTPAGTAVTDTHRLYSDLGGSPRTFVFVDPAQDSVETFDADGFAQSIVDGRAVGSNGPFFHVELENSDGDRAAIGDVLASTDGAQTAYVTVDVPEWMAVDTIDIYSNLEAEDIIMAPGVQNGDPVLPTSTHPIDFEPSDLVEVASGEVAHKHWTKTVEIPLAITEDAYMVVVVRSADDTSSMWPVIPQVGVKPFAFANPIYVDADGGGYDHPPLAALADTPPPADRVNTAALREFRSVMTLTPEEQLGNLFEGMSHEH